MDNTKHQEAVKNAVKDKFRGHTIITSKSTPMYPDSAEREFKRVTNAYIRLLNETLKENLPELMELYKREMRKDARYDDWQDIVYRVRQIFQKIADSLEQRLSAFRLNERVEKISRQAKNTSLREWKKAVHSTLGIDLMDDYYSGSFYEETLRRWVDDNVLQIKSIPNDALGEMQQIVLNGFHNGDTVSSIAKQIQDEYSLSRKKAQLLARDQLSTLNAQITKQQHEDAGCKKYRWSDSHDSRVRKCHKALRDKIISWDDPPEMWYETKSRGRVYTGRRCHPGEDYCCRCVAIPVFDINTIDVPMKQTK